jgi:nucleoside-diphosphate-sugar epimerase
MEMVMPRRRVLVTGSSGRLGSKLVRYLLGGPVVNGARRAYHLVLLDDSALRGGGAPRDPLDEPVYEGFPSAAADDAAAGTYEHVDADLRAPPHTWAHWLIGCDAVVHFAAAAVYPTSTVEAAAASMEMTSAVVAAAADAGVRRFVFASSNFVFGGRMHEGAVAGDGPPLGEATPVTIECRYSVPGVAAVSATAYAASKVAGEAILRAAVARAPRLSAAAVRVGWVRDGAERADAAVPAGTVIGAALAACAAPGGAAEAARAAAAAGHAPPPATVAAWFRLMLISNRDLCGVFAACVEYEPPAGAPRFMAVNGVGANTGMRWARDHWAEIGYTPADDCVKCIGRDAFAEVFRGRF